MMNNDKKKKTSYYIIGIWPYTHTRKHTYAQLRLGGRGQNYKLPTILCCFSMWIMFLLCSSRNPLHNVAHKSFKLYTCNTISSVHIFHSPNTYLQDQCWWCWNNTRRYVQRENFLLKYELYRSISIAHVDIYRMFLTIWGMVEM